MLGCGEGKGRCGKVCSSVRGGVGKCWGSCGEVCVGCGEVCWGAGGGVGKCWGGVGGVEEGVEKC